MAEERAKVHNVIRKTLRQATIPGGTTGRRGGWWDILFTFLRISGIAGSRKGGGVDLVLFLEFLLKAGFVAVLGRRGGARAICMGILRTWGGSCGWIPVGAVSQSGHTLQGR